jgi:ribosomal protein L11 methyltransferase
MKSESQNKIWYAADCITKSVAAEAVEFGFMEAEANGIEIDYLGELIIGEKVKIIGYFSVEPKIEFLHDKISQSLEIYSLDKSSIEDISIREVENRDWLAEWKKSWKATETAKFIIAPPWQVVENKDKFLIQIEPAMAFGTGTHETTKLCLKAIEDNFVMGESFFDVGTGTGILAFAVAKLDAKNTNILACDNDSDSIKIASENAELNLVSENIKFFVGSIEETSATFDFVCANLTADVILPMLHLLVAKSKRILVLSGILSIQEDSITTKLRELGANNFIIENDGEWISVVIKK